jgi:dimethylhistidine N-methyltransferase
MDRSKATNKARFIDLEPSGESFLEAVYSGLGSDPKRLPAKFFYDEEGSRLFEKISQLQEYYPTRTEIALLEEIAPQLRARLPAGTQLIEFGSGSNDKVRILLEGVDRFDSYVPIDISREYLRAQADELAADFPEILVTAICADYTMDLRLPQHTSDLPEARLGFFPGSTIGNMKHHEAISFLSRAAEILGAGAGFLIGVDLKKNPATLYAAYNDADGVTSAFNLNLLRRINRELGADFDLAAFRHDAFYDEAEGRIEMHLVSLADQSVTIDGQSIAISRGECIHTEDSHKYTLDEFIAMGRAAGLAAEESWTDDSDLFSVHLFRIQ